MSKTEFNFTEWAVNLALRELLFVAIDFFEACPQLRELKVEKQDDGVWVILPDGTKHTLPPDDLKKFLEGGPVT
jgi:hypothetical protein